MAQVIEFDTLARFIPAVKWALDEKRGKIIPFLSEREVPEKLIYAAHEELDSECPFWPECDDPPIRPSLSWLSH